MEIAPLLKVMPGVTAIMGGGGKTTLMYTLGEELSQFGRVILTTSTHIFAPCHCPVLTDAAEEDVAEALKVNPIVCVGERAKEGKLSSPRLAFDVLAKLADYVLVEADGSKGLPLKAHAPYEPVIPECASKTILVVGIDGLGKPIGKACHRSSLYASMVETTEDRVVTPEVAALVIIKEGFGDVVYINKVETEADWHRAKALAPLLPCPVVAGSLYRKEYLCLQ